MKVKIFDYGRDSKNYYVIYKVTEIDPEDQQKIQDKVEGKAELKNGDMYIKTYFEEKYYPLGSADASLCMDDFIAREEIEMIIYLTSLLGDEKFNII
ncbi:MAG: hypothetical protein PHY59_06775 [Methanobacterium sp.]|nr:hypothetical protein [Methanobacterium sp.]